MYRRSHDVICPPAHKMPHFISGYFGNIFQSAIPVEKAWLGSTSIGSIPLRKRIPHEPVTSYPNGSAAGGRAGIELVNIEGRAATSQTSTVVQALRLLHAFLALPSSEMLLHSKAKNCAEIIVLYSTAQTSYAAQCLLTSTTEWGRGRGCRNKEYSSAGKKSRCT